MYEVVLLAVAHRIQSDRKPGLQKSTNSLSVKLASPVWLYLGGGPLYEDVGCGLYD